MPVTGRHGMKRAFAVTAIVMVAASIGFAADTPPADEIVGQWYTADNASIVTVVNKGGKFYGTIIWLAEPNYPANEPDGDAGKPKRNKNHPEKARQKDPIIGLQVLKDFVYNAADKTWDSGTIYDPDNGRTYKCVIRFQDDPKGIDGKSLHVRGYIGIPTLGRTTIWYRVPEDKMQKVDAN